MSRKNRETEQEKRRRRTRMYQKYYGDDKSDNSLPKGCNFLDIFHADFVRACGEGCVKLVFGVIAIVIPLLIFMVWIF